MPYDNRRPDRVAEAIREEVAGFLADGVKDPRVRGLVTVTGVDVTRDLRSARVFVSIMGTDVEREETLAGLTAVAAHLRGRLGRALRLRVAPELSFRTDQTVAQAARIETLLEQIRQERESRDGGEDADAAPPDGAPADAAGDAPREGAPSAHPAPDAG